MPFFKFHLKNLICQKDDKVDISSSLKVGLFRSVPNLEPKDLRSVRIFMLSLKTSEINDFYFICF